MPFWALTVLYAWKGFQNNKIFDWLLLGLFAALGILSKYLFIYLLIAIDIFCIYLLINKKINYKFLISLLSFFLILTPHLIWLVENDYTTITYALHRTSATNFNVLESHIYNPLLFLGKQIVILLPFALMLLFLVSRLKIKFNFKDKKFLFLIVINIVPIALVFITSFLMGAKIRTMWMTPFYLFIGVLFVYIFQKKIIFKKIKYFFSVFLILFTLSPSAYLYSSITQTDKRTDYPGRKIADQVQKKWDENFINEIMVVAGDEWYGGNLSYHLKSRPKWDNILENKKKSPIKDPEAGFVLIGDKDIMSNICKGVYFTVSGIKKTELGICMIGRKQ